MRLYFIFVLCFVFCLPNSTLQQEDRTALDDYVDRPDENYAWELMDEWDESEEGYKSYLINLTSQQWKTEEETNQPIWWHYMIIAIPNEVQYTDSAFLMITNGNMDDSVPTPEGDSRFQSAAEYALGMGIPAIWLKMIPNQRLQVAGDPEDRWRREDDLIAWTWRRYIDDPTDPDILLRLPMVKASVRAMDTMEVFVNQIRPEIEITSFMVAGGSKRGWTTYLVGAVDERVAIMSPSVLTCLNLQEVMHHQYMAYDGWSFSNIDYWNENIMADLDHPNTDSMLEIIDPYAYRERLDMPKLIISASGDEHFMPDDTWYFWDDLIGQNYYLMVENSGHSIPSPQSDWVKETRIAFFHAIKTGFQLPEMSWQRAETEDSGSINVVLDRAPLRISAWYADTNDGERRDFRARLLDDEGSVVDSNIVWYEDENILDLGDGEYRVEFDIPEEGWRCFFIKMIFEGPTGRNFTFTTETNIIPDYLPYDRCSTPEECQGRLL